MINIVTWLWGTKYISADVEKLKNAVSRNLDQRYNFILSSDRPMHLENSKWIEIQDKELTKLKGCFARLRMFDPEWQKSIGAKKGEKIVCIDLDVVTTGKLDPFFNRDESFVIVQGANAANPCPYNGSMFMLRAGEHSDVWKDFSIQKASAVPYYEFPDDQGWFWHKMPQAAGWKAGQEGLYAFQKPGWPGGENLPDDARIVIFPGWRSPEKFKHLQWVKENWR